MRRIIEYIVLPPEVTPFERSYLERVNRIALVFFWCHLPVFMAVAWAADTGPMLALGLTAFTLIGPTVAYFTLRSERVKSMVYGFTAMGMGGLLVHFGQGPVQIEMHFYFFALLAMLSLFGNPLVNVVAAVTVAVHHGLLWALLPSSVFNYDAPFWVVGVHAAFVVLETFATCFISRSFFNNVIGLEKVVLARTEEVRQRSRDMRLVLDNVGQGFITIDRSGVMSPERSAIVTQWLGEASDGATFVEYVEPVDQGVAEWFELSMESLTDGFLPMDVALDQLPRRMTLGETTLRLDYSPILDQEGELDKLLIVISDITHHMAREKAEAEQREMMRVFEHIMNDKTSFLEFLQEGDELVRMVVDYPGDDLPRLKRTIHTLKGNASLFGLSTVADLCHAMEDEIVETGEAPSAAIRDSLSERWAKTKDNLDKFLGDRESQRVEIDNQDYEAILRAVLAGDSKDKLAAMITAWKLEPMRRRLDFIADKASALAKRLGKGSIEFVTSPGGLRLEPERWASFWSAFQHAIRNAIDHGIEDAELRVERGKSPEGRIEFSTFRDGDHFVVQIADDGQGIDWDEVGRRAAAAGIAVREDQQLRDAIFREGISTKDTVTQFSGRGVGMGAMREECHRRDGVVEILSERGKGTTVRCRFPVDQMYDQKQLAAVA